MSVYSLISLSQLEELFINYPLGNVINFDGIADGVDNTNYRVTTGQGDFVLTVFESATDNELMPIFSLLAELNANGLPCPLPQPDRHNRLLHKFNNKPAAVFNHLTGIAVPSPSTDQCRTLGAAQARLHLCLKNVELPVKNRYELSAFKTIFNQIKEHLPATDISLLEDEFAYQAKHNWSSLPGGVIHGDLFRDNVLFVGNQLSGILDFYDACAGPWLVDIAIAVNDWCCDNGMINTKKTTALLTGYQSVRPLQVQEQQLWPTVLRAAAVRFWLSRLQHQLYPRPSVITQQKDPQTFRYRLQQHRQQQSQPALVSINSNTFNLWRSA